MMSTSSSRPSFRSNPIAAAKPRIPNRCAGEPRQADAQDPVEEPRNGRGNTGEDAKAARELLNRYDAGRDEPAEAEDECCDGCEASAAHRI